MKLTAYEIQKIGKNFGGLADCYVSGRIGQW